jgi:hypothetical protein
MIYNHYRVRVRVYPLDLGYDHIMSKRLNLWNRNIDDSNTGANTVRQRKRVRLKYGRSYRKAEESVEPVDELPPYPPVPGDPTQQAPQPPPGAAPAKAPQDHQAGKSKRFSHVPRAKRRRCAMSISVSQEEEALIRAHVSKLDTTFSAWARGIIFRSMQKKVPSRRG